MCFNFFHIFSQPNHFNLLRNFTVFQPSGGKFVCFDHITFYVGNAKQAASYYTTRLGFEPLAYQGLETGNRQFAKHVVKQKKVCYISVFILICSIWFIFVQLFFKKQELDKIAYIGKFSLADSD